MSRLGNSLAGASALVLLALPVHAQTMPVFGGYAFGQYATSEVAGESVDMWSGGGSIVAGIAQGFNLQGDIGYATAEVDGVGDLNVWNFGGAAFYRSALGANGGPGFAAGLAIGRTSLDIDSFDYDLTTYGAFGEIYISEMVTGFINGGWVDGDFDLDGNYVGGGLRVYPMPNLSLTGSINHATGEGDSDATDFGIKGEFLFSSMVPVALYAGYNNISSDGDDGIDVWTIGLRVLFDPAGTLYQRDVSGPIRNASPSNNFRF